MTERLYARAGWVDNGTEHVEQITATNHGDLRDGIARLRVKHAHRTMFYIDAWADDLDPNGRPVRRPLLVREDTAGTPMRQTSPTNEETSP